MFPLEVDLAYKFGSLVARTVKNLPVMHEIRVHWAGHLEKGMATHFSILAWRIPWTEDLGRLAGGRGRRCGGGGGVVKKLDKTEQLTLSLPYIFLNLAAFLPLQYWVTILKHSCPSHCLLLKLNRTSHTLERFVVF